MLRTGEGDFARRTAAIPAAPPALGARHDVPARAAPTARVATRWSRLAPAAIALAIVGWFATRMNFSTTPDGDPALHLKLIQDVASTQRLPTELPNLAARIGPGGAIEAIFPYSYPPLFHGFGGLMYAAAGIHGVMLINAVAVAVITYIVARFVARRLPWYVAALAGAALWLTPTVQATFTNVYMEPMMLGLLFPAAWCCYLAMTTRGVRYGILAGMLLGLSIGTRQVAIFYAAVLAAVIVVHLFERRCWHWRRLKLELPWLLTMAFTCVAVAAPSLLYLAYTNGSIGYADITLPGMAPKLAVDVEANAYIASITKPDNSAIQWLDKYQNMLLYSDRWLPLGIAAIPLPLFAIGATHLYARGGISRFFARWAVMQFAAEVLLFLTLHGNARYLVVSQMLFYAMVPVGGYVLTRAFIGACANLPMVRLLNTLSDARVVLRGCAAAIVAVAAVLVVVSVAPRGYWLEYRDRSDHNLREFRGRSYADMGAWVNAYTPPDSIILTPRTYTAELTWERPVAWVTFYGNAWVADAISTPDPALANAILRLYGVDYVVIPAPPGTYLDQIPVYGMRSYLQLGAPETPYFTLVHKTEDEDGLTRGGRDLVHGLRLYSVNEPQPPPPPLLQAMP